MSRAQHAFWTYFAAAGVIISGATLYHTAATVSDEAIKTRAALEGAYSIVLICDARGRITYANDNVQKYTGYTTAELRAGGMSLIIVPDMEQRHAVSYAAYMQNPTYGETTFKRRLKICTKSGERIWAALTVRVISEGGEPSAYAFILPDKVIEEALAFPQFDPTATSATGRPTPAPLLKPGITSSMAQPEVVATSPSTDVTVTIDQPLTLHIDAVTTTGK